MVVVCELQEKEVPAGNYNSGLSSSAWSECCNHHQAGDMAGAGLPVARVASLLLARLSLKRLNRFEPKYIWVQIYLNIPYSNRE